MKSVLRQCSPEGFTVWMSQQVFSIPKIGSRCCFQRCSGIKNRYFVRMLYREVDVMSNQQYTASVTRDASEILQVYISKDLSWFPYLFLYILLKKTFMPFANISKRNLVIGITLCTPQSIFITFTLWIVTIHTNNIVTAETAPQHIPII